jgi:hypothetical protein
MTSSGELDNTADGGTHAAPGELAPGMQLGKYTLDRRLGAGGMGVVWAARDPDLERAVAIKVLITADADPTQRARLLREARAMARLKHPNVLTVYEVGSAGDRDYIVMELVEGANLDAWLRAQPPRGETWHAILAAGRGLAAAHAAGLVHRDFKPHNVLRSRDARVLVTDFGLARSAEPNAPPPASAPIAAAVEAFADTLQPTPRTPTLLDSTLTQTGAMVGTPAYMAPEQFLGAPPDPRTDQFAFCVTAWQALTGERPFRGQTIEELQRAAAAGVAGVVARLPRRVRGVLARGLAADRDARWPDLDALLVALERASVARRTWAYAIPGFALVAAGVLFATMHGTSTPHLPAPACDAQAELADAWSPARRAALDQRVGAAATAVGGALDELRAGWLDSYATACAAKRTPVALSRLGCLLGERDELAALGMVADTLPGPAFERLDLRGMLPRIEACTGDAPIVPPELPQDAKTRTKLVELRAEIATLQLRDGKSLLDQADDFRRRVRALGWAPLEAQLDQAFGAAALRLGRYDDARQQFVAAAERAAQQHDYRLEAWARVSRLEAESAETAEPADPAREKTLEHEARDAVHRAGDDPDLADSIDAIIGENKLARGEASDLGGLTRAIWWGDAKRNSRIAALQIALVVRLNLLRHNYTDAAALERPNLSGPGYAELERLLAEVAWRRGDLEGVHSRTDKLFEPSPFGTRGLVIGRVVDTRGAPVAHARVVAWQGELAGDARRMYTSPDFHGELETADDDGKFRIAVPEHGALMAERDDLRSTPMATAPLGEAVTVVIGPVHAVTLRATGAHLPALDAFVRIDVDGARWLDRAVVGSAGRARVAGIPAGAAVAGLAGALDRAGHLVLAGPARDGAAIAWPSGTTLDLVTAQPGEVTVTRAGGSDVAHAPARPIGFSSETPEGRKLYARGELHAIVRDIAPGSVQACEIVAGESHCASVAVPRGAGTIAVQLK